VYVLGVTWPNEQLSIYEKEHCAIAEEIFFLFLLWTPSPPNEPLQRHYFTSPTTILAVTRVLVIKPKDATASFLYPVPLTSETWSDLSKFFFFVSTWNVRRKMLLFVIRNLSIATCWVSPKFSRSYPSLCVCLQLSVFKLIQ